MRVTDVHVEAFERPDGRLLGTACIVLDGRLVVDGILIVSTPGQADVDVLMPAVRRRDGTYKQVVGFLHPMLQRKLNYLIKHHFETEARRKESLAEPVDGDVDDSAVHEASVGYFDRWHREAEQRNWEVPEE